MLLINNSPIPDHRPDNPNDEPALLIDADDDHDKLEATDCH